jgi:hypothetical protein
MNRGIVLVGMSGLILGGFLICRTQRIENRAANSAPLPAAPPFVDGVPLIRSDDELEMHFKLKSTGDYDYAYCLRHQQWYRGACN